MPEEDDELLELFGGASNEAPRQPPVAAAFAAPAASSRPQAPKAEEDDEFSQLFSGAATTTSRPVAARPTTFQPMAPAPPRSYQPPRQQYQQPYQQQYQQQPQRPQPPPSASTVQFNAPAIDLMTTSNYQAPRQPIGYGLGQVSALATVKDEGGGEDDFSVLLDDDMGAAAPPPGQPGPAMGQGYGRPPPPRPPPLGPRPPGPPPQGGPRPGMHGGPPGPPGPAGFRPPGQGGGFRPPPPPGPPPALPFVPVGAASFAVAQRLREADAAFPSQAGPDQPIKLPKQNRVTPDEYKEFLSLGHGDIFDLDLDRCIDMPWRLPTVNVRDFFNYDMNERSWRDYCAKVARFRAQYSLSSRIEVLMHDDDYSDKPQMAARRPRRNMEPEAGVVLTLVADEEPQEGQEGAALAVNIDYDAPLPAQPFFADFSPISTPAHEAAALAESEAEMQQAQMMQQQQQQQQQQMLMQQRMMMMQQQQQHGEDQEQAGMGGMEQQGGGMMAQARQQQMMQQQQQQALMAARNQLAVGNLPNFMSDAQQEQQQQQQQDMHASFEHIMHDSVELLHIDGPTQQQQAAQQAQPAGGAANGLAGASSYELADAFMADDAEASGRKRQRVGEAEAVPQYVASGAAFMAEGLDTLQEDPLGLLGAAEPEPLTAWQTDSKAPAGSSRPRSSSHREHSSSQRRDKDRDRDRDRDRGRGRDKGREEERSRRHGSSERHKSSSTRREGSSRDKDREHKSSSHRSSKDRDRDKERSKR